MQSGLRGRVAWAIATVAVLGLSTGCDQDKPKGAQAADAGVAEAGPQQPVLGGRLGAAVAAAEASGRPPASGPGAADAPPETGVFAPGAGEAALPKDKPFKIEVLGEGDEPRVALAQKLDPKAEQRLVFHLSVRNGGQRGMPNLDIELQLKPDKAKKEDKPAAAASPESPEPVAITAKVASATVASMSLGGPPKELLDVLGKLKGSLLHYRLAPSGQATDFKVELAKGADPGLESVVATLGEVIGAMSPILPDKPMGRGAYWMVTDRVSPSGVRVLRYRVFKVDKVEDGAVSLSLDTRQYAEDGEMKVPSGGQEIALSIDQFESAGKGSVSWAPGAFAPPGGEINQRLQARLVPPGAQQTNQRMMAQIEVTAKVGAPAAAEP